MHPLQILALILCGAGYGLAVFAVAERLRPARSERLFGDLPAVPDGLLHDAENAR